MSWQADKAVPLLAGEAFCEKTAFDLLAGRLSHQDFGRTSMGRAPAQFALRAHHGTRRRLAGVAQCGALRGAGGAATISTFLLAYQVAIWLATDAPLLAAVSVALLGAYIGFYAARARTLRGYLLMHTALAFGFLSKSAVAGWCLRWPFSR